MTQAETQQVGFTIHGDFLTNFFREHLLDGDSQKTVLMFLQSFGHMPLEVAQQVLRGEKKLVGVNDLDLVDDVGLSPEFMKNLAWVYRKERHVPGVWTREAFAQYMVGIPEPEPEEPPYETMHNVLDAVEEAGFDLHKMEDGEYAMLRKSYPQSAADKIVDKIIGPGGDMLDQMMAAMTAVGEDLDEPASGPPVPYTLQPGDDSHYHWTIDPEGNLYKVPFQEHGNWFVKYADHLKDSHLIFDEYGEGDPYKHGWIRISGGPGMGMMVMVHPKTPVHLGALRKFLMAYSMNQFGFDLSGTGVFELGIDYKRIIRLLNEHFA